MSGILCLKWNNHTSTFIKTLDSLRTKELYCDATIACNGKFFPVHRFVLTTCSEYFEEIFERTQCKHPIIIIKDIEQLHIEALLNYMYNGEVNVLQDRLPGLIKAAEALKIRGLAVWEDQNEGKKNKEKKKLSHSSPVQSKNRKLITKISPAKIQQNTVEEVYDVQDDDDDDDITEDVNDSVNINDVDMESNIQENGEDTVDETMKAPNEDAVDIKSEPSDIFEAVEEDFPPNASNEKQSERNDPQPVTNQRDTTLSESNDTEGLFVSLLSPNNTHSSEDESPPSPKENSSNLAIPQCSTWNDAVSGMKQEDLNDEVVVLEDDSRAEETEANSTEPFFSDTFSITESMNESMNDLPDQENQNIRTQCPLCSYQSKYKTNMKTHIARVHAGVQPFSCSICKYRSATKESLKIHMRKHTGEKPYKCPLCPYRAAHYNSFKIHSYIHTKDKPYQCNQCSYRATQKKSLIKHKRRHKIT